MPRLGHFDYRFDPDETAMLPRPFQLAGEAKKVTEPGYPRGEKPPPRPEQKSATDALRDTGWVGKVDRAFLKKFPHNTHDAYGTTRGIDVKQYTAAEIAYLTLGEKKKKGVYMKYIDHMGYNVLTGETYAVYGYKRVPDYVLNTYYLKASDLKYYLDKPDALIKAARWLWANGFKKQYWQFTARISLAIKQRNEELSKAEQAWIKNYEAQQAAELKNWQDYTSFWRTS
jgi:hypothetical protein